MFRKRSLGAIGTSLLLVMVLLGACVPQQSEETAPVGESPQAARADAQRGGTLRFAVDAEPGELDPHKAVAGITRRYLKLMFNTLTTTDAAGNVVPELAESWSTTDNKAFVFKLRKDVKFHDGTDFNAAAVKYNIERLFTDPGVGEVRRTFLLGSGFTSVDILDDYTVKFNLKAPNAAFPAFLEDGLATSMVSPAAAEKLGDQFKVQPVGTGPFEFEEWVKGDHVTVKRFDGYWRKDEKGSPLPYLDRIIFKPIPDSTVRLNALRSGDVDIVDDIDITDMGTVKSNANLKSVDWGNQRFHLTLNCAIPPFDNKALRQALAWAIDTEEIHRALYEGSGGVGQAPLDPKNWAFDAQGKFYTRDVAKARQKLAEGGKSNGFKFVAKNYNKPFPLRISQVVKSQLAEVGIDMEIVPGEDRQLAGERVGKKFGAAIFTRSRGMPSDPAVGLFDYFAAEGYANFGTCVNPQVDALLERGTQVLDRVERKATYAQLQALVLDDAHSVWVHHDAITTAMNKNVQGFVPNIDLYHLQYDWLGLQK